jgi:hypothetical protein
MVAVPANANAAVSSNVFVLIVVGLLMSVCGRNLSDWRCGVNDFLEQTLSLNCPEVRTLAASMKDVHN